MYATQPLICKDCWPKKKNHYGPCEHAMQVYNAGVEAGKAALASSEGPSPSFQDGVNEGLKMAATYVRDHDNLGNIAYKEILMLASSPPAPSSAQCSVCGKLSNPLYMCDEDPHDNQYCGDCFKKVGCHDNHDEGCATIVLSDGKDCVTAPTFEEPLREPKPIGFREWWLSEGIKHMPSGNEPPEHASIAELAWVAATFRAMQHCPACEMRQRQTEYAMRNSEPQNQQLAAAPPPTASFRTQVDALRELSKKATPGPWQLAKDNYGVDRIWDRELDCDIASCEGDGSIEWQTRKANAEFLVACVNYVRALLSEAEPQPPQ